MSSARAVLGAPGRELRCGQAAGVGVGDSGADGAVDGVDLEVGVCSMMLTRV